MQLEAPASAAAAPLAVLTPAAVAAAAPLAV